MAQQDEGIMALNAANAGAGMPPEDTEIDMFEFRRQAYPVVKDSVREVSPEAYGEMQSMLSSELAGAGDLDPEGVKQLLEIVDYINENPEQYPEIRAALISEGVIDEDDFPAEMDVEYFATLEVVLQEALMGSDAQAAEMVQGPVGMMPPQGFAKGGIAEAAQLVANRGRYGDTMLAHITPAEARLLRSRGGSGTINPATGLPEFFLKKAFKSVTKAVKSVTKAVKSVAKASGLVKVVKAVHKAVKPVVKKVLASPIGRIAVTVGLTMIGVPPPIASALVTKAAGGTWKDAFKAAAVSYLAGPSSPIASTVSKFTPFLSGMNPAVAAGIRSGITSTGASLLTGSSLKEAVTAGVTSGLVTGIQAASAAPAAGSENMAPVRDMSTTDGAAVRLGMDPGAVDPVTGAPLLPGQAAPAANLVARPLTPADAFGTVTAPAAAGAAPSASQFGLGSDAYNLGAPDTGGFGLGSDAYNLGAPAAAPAAPASRFGEFLPSAGQAGAGAPPAPTVDDRSLYQQGKDFMFGKTPTPLDINAKAEELMRTYGDKITGPEARKMATDELTPGIMRTYGPSVAAGLGVMALTGGFKPKEPEQLPMADRISEPIEVPPSLQTPIQNLPGVIYDSQGNIIGSKPWDPYTSSQSDKRPTEVSTPGIMSLQLPPNYVGPPGSPTMSSSPIPQPYNTSSMYTNLMQPQRYNAGGIAGFAKGGYPRRIGQIDGPGTETSDDIPAMLSDGEFVMTARAVRGAGNGSRRAGAKKMYAMMHQLEQNAARG
jgi:hypothetical protein